ncbi:hypothetical protein BOX15_Mlig013713g3 [Macrostomum lignano]|uniref:Large ribosomal subunit protein bL17m n=1 Tax=Macrostomum lignano TaxID=282301 RepID=A0A267GWL6_9PLAT|nr:hypothetical protein BOX15_Mlig013713g4 [Macrostomum lignano]PAA75398.1 hypothetical protein BOX15_Mlig013713g5 [Macrostomum lignano]PAA89689.1 hypothetical protein BOX15_Mlig013713g3 [Macrostomum lignano]
MSATAAAKSAATRMRFNFPRKQVRIDAPMGFGTGQLGRLLLIRDSVSALVAKERLEFNDRPVAVNTQQYSELLLHKATLLGPDNPAMRDLAFFWLENQQLVRKMFDELVPRLAGSSKPYTRLHRVGSAGLQVLEIRDNQLPPLVPRVEPGVRSQYLINYLLKCAREDPDFKPV